MAISVAGPTFDLTNGTTAIDTLLTQEANRIGPDIHKRTLHVSPWIDLIRQTAFPEGMGTTLGTIIYDRALPTTGTDGNSLGLNWTNVGTGGSPDSLVTTSTRDQIIPSTSDSFIGAQVGKGNIQFGRQFKQYSLRRAIVESPRLNVEDLRYAAYRTEQLRAIMDAMTEATRHSWEERYRDEYDRTCKNILVCKSSNSLLISSGKEGVQTWDVALGGDPSGNISNKVMDSIYFRLVRGGAGANAYGRENARPVFAAVMSSEASYNLTIEDQFRDDYRYNNAKVGELIAPLGIERSHRGFYHLIDDLAPRFTADTDTDAGGSDTADGTLNRVYPYSVASGIITDNAAYETAPFEALYILHSEVMESQIPTPNISGPGVSFNPVDYKGKFNWLNIQDEIRNPDRTTGFFRGVLASATKPIKTEFGYVVVFKRDTTTRAA